MKIQLVIPLLTLLSFNCQAQRTDCEIGTQEAEQDLKGGVLALYFVGLPIPTTITYQHVFESDYEVINKGGGDIVTEKGECYNQVMVSAIKERYGDQIFEDVQRKVDSLQTHGLGNRYADFPGGNVMLQTFLDDNNQLKNGDISLGEKVFVEFTIDTAGALYDVVVKKGATAACSQCDTEAVRLVKSMPRWEPRMVNGQKVETRKIIAVRF